MFSHDYYEIREISIKDQAGTSYAGTDANKAVCEKALITAKAKGSWILYRSRGVRHDCGTVLNEATTVMGYRV